MFPQDSYHVRQNGHQAAPGIVVLLTITLFSFPDCWRIFIQIQKQRTTFCPVGVDAVDAHLSTLPFHSWLQQINLSVAWAKVHHMELNPA